MFEVDGDKKSEPFLVHFAVIVLCMIVGCESCLRKVHDSYILLQ